MKCFDLIRLNRALEVLTTVRENIDPRAFIAGGLPLSLYLGRNFGHDIDIFFSSPNFDYSAVGGSAYRQIAALFPEVSKHKVGTEMYWYNKRFARIAKLHDVDFIQVNKAPERMQEYVFEKFDLDICKIALTGHKDEYQAYLHLHPTREMLSALERKAITYDTQLADYKYENDAQTKVTLSRVDKYKERFPEFTFTEHGADL